MKGVDIAVDIMATEIMAKYIMATAARRRVRQRHSPVRRRPSSNSRRIGRPAAPTGTSASKPGKPRRPPKHNQQNKIEIAKKGTRSGSLSHLLPSRGCSFPRFRPNTVLFVRREHILGKKPNCTSHGWQGGEVYRPSINSTLRRCRAWPVL